MAKLKITKQKIQELEGIADFAYKALQTAVETGTPGAFHSAQYLYEGMGDYLSKLIAPTRHPYVLNKGSKRAEKIEEFILQWVLMFNPPSEKIRNYKIKVTEDTNDGMGGLKAYIDAEDYQDSAEGKVFRSIGHKASELRKGGKYDLIMKAENYVREKDINIEIVYD